MNLPIELIKYGLLAIVGIVICFKVFELTKKLVKKWKNKDEDDFDMDSKDLDNI